MVFGVSPAVAGVEQAADDGFPNFIQFQQAGVNLGGPDADTVNLSTGLHATRGTGESENVITIEADAAVGTLSVLENGVLVAANVETLNIVGAQAVVAESGGVVTIDIAAAGAAPVLAFFLSAVGISYGVDNGTWAHTAGVASADASWNSSTNQIDFARTGIYEVLVSSLIQLGDTSGHVTAYSLFSNVGNDIPSSLFQGSIDYQTIPSALTTLNSTTRFVEVTADGTDLVRDVVVSFTASGEGATTYQADLAVTVRRLGDAP